MKILHLVPTYIPAIRYGGPIESVHALNASLVAEGADVTVYTTSIDGEKNMDVPLGTPVLKDGVKIFYFPPSFPRAWFYSSAMKRALKKTIRDFDIVHITSVFLSVSFLGARLAKKFGIPSVISPRGSLMKDPMRRKGIKKSIYFSFFEKKNLQHATGIFFTTPQEETEFREQGFPLQNGFVIPNALREGMKEGDGESFRKRFGILPSARVVLFMGRLNPIKGLDILLPAFQKIAHENTDAVLVLAGPDENNFKKVLEEKIKELGIEGRVIFTGLLHTEEKYSAFSACDIFTLPSYSESFGMAALEAMFFGKPVVLTEGVALAPFVSRAGAGEISAQNEKSLSEALQSFFEHPERMKECGEKGRALVSREFSPKTIAQKCLNAYDTILQKRI
jgi:glycosyltransferase involved in cell wall biosynthesis